ncbi:MAG: hypothetical protein GY771_00215 [bacterium]|nr:hypothetical protein [bacterium]
MDATVKQMIDGYRMGVDGQAGMINDKSKLEPIEAVLARMEEIAEQPGVDMMKFQELVGTEGLMEKYGAEMAKLSEAMTAGMDQKIAAADEMAAEQKPVDIKEIDLTDIELVVKPHRQIYDMTAKDDPKLAHQKAAYEALFALAGECATIPEFNRRSIAEGHQQHLGLSATWDGNITSFNLEVQHKQPDMITWALNALEVTRDNPYPESIAYYLNETASLNERKMAVRQSNFQPYNSFAGELSGYLLLDHSEHQRQKAVNMYDMQKEYTGWDIDDAAYHPYIRQLLTLGDTGQAAELGPDYLGLLPFIRAGWYMDARLSPEEKAQFKDMNDVPPPPPYPYPHRTGPVGGVELTVSEPMFACPFDTAYPISIKVTNTAPETRNLDVSKGLRIWIINEDKVINGEKVPAVVPDTLAPGESVEIDGNLYDWGLPNEERLFLVGFDLGIVGDFDCDLALKYSDPKKLNPSTIPNYYLKPFDGGVAADPMFVMPHRPLPEYPFPIAVE